MGKAVASLLGDNDAAISRLLLCLQLFILTAGVLPILPLKASYQNFVWLFIVACLVTFYRPARADSNSAQVSWDETFGDESIRSEAGVLAFSKASENLLIAGTSREATNATHSIGNFWLWEINSEGKRIKESEIKSPNKDQELTSFPYVKDIKVLNNRAALLIIEFTPGHPYLVKLDEADKQILTKDLVQAQRNATLVRIVPTADHNFLLIGHQSGNALAMKVDLEGNILWKKVFERKGQENSFSSGFATKDGGAIIIGSSKPDTQQAVISFNVWVVKIDASGNIQSEQTFPGRLGNITGRTDGSFVVVYYASNSTSQDVWLQAFDANFKSLWKMPLFSAKFGLLGFQIATTTDGSVVIATATDDLKLFVAKVGKDGKRVWEFRGDITYITPIVSGLVATNNEVFVLTLKTGQNTENQPNDKVRLIKLTTP